MMFLFRLACDGNDWKRKMPSKAHLVPECKCWLGTKPALQFSQNQKMNFYSLHQSNARFQGCHGCYWNCEKALAPGKDATIARQDEASGFALGS